MKYLPFEIVDMIADYHDYDKYCKPEHKLKLRKILQDIKSMNNVMKPISPRIAKECWGADLFEDDLMETFYLMTDLVL